MSESMTKDDGPGNRSDGDIAYFECPHCGEVHDTEGDVRLHVTQTDDHKHKGRNGFSQSESVLAYDSSGERVDVLEGDPSQMTDYIEGDIETSLIPDDMADSELDKAIVQTGLIHRDAPVAAVHRKVNAKLAADEHLPDDVSYHKVRVTLDDVLGNDDRPDGRVQSGMSESVADIDESDTDPHDDLTEKQEAAINQYCINPVRTWSAMRRAVGLSSGYIRSVITRDDAMQIIDERHVPDSEESRLMHAAWTAVDKGDDVSEESLANTHSYNGGYNWAESYTEATYLQRAIIDYIAAKESDGGSNLDDSTIADDLHFPEAYVRLVRERLLADVERTSDDESDSESVKTNVGNASYSGPADGVDLTMSSVSERTIKGTHHEQRQDDIGLYNYDWRTPTSHETAPLTGPRWVVTALQTARPDADPVERYRCPGCHWVYESLPSMRGHLGGSDCDAPDEWHSSDSAVTIFPDGEFVAESIDDATQSDPATDTDDVDETDESTESPDRAALDDETTTDTGSSNPDRTASSVGQTPSESGSTLMPSTQRRQDADELRTEVERLRSFVDRGANDRDQEYAAGQYDALTQVLELIDDHARDTDNE